MAQQSKAGTHWRKVHRRKNEHLVFAEDLGPVGTKLDVEIVDSGVIEVSGAEKRTKPMPWLAFAGAKKKLALNVTNCKTMTSIAGTPVVEQWRGWITLVVVRTTYTDSTSGTRETTDAIRIAAERPEGKRRSSGPAHAPNTSGSGATDEPASQLAPSAEPPELSDEDKRAIALAEREEANRGR
jgi:hypothetical protein